MTRHAALIAATIALAVPSVATASSSTAPVTSAKTVRGLTAQVAKLKRQKRALQVKVKRLRSERNAALATAAQLPPTRALADARGRALTDVTLRWLAANQTHGWVQDNLSSPELEARLRAGERLTITCGTVARLAVHILRGYGLEARVVNILSLDPVNGIDDGHKLMETRVPGGTWEVYDVDTNRKPVDASGAGITATTFVDMPVRQYSLLANDQAVDWTGAQQEWIDHFTPVFASREGLESWYDHILGVVAYYG